MPSTLIFLQLLLAHLLGDFALQSTRMVEERRKKHARSPWLWVHVATHGGLFWLVSGPGGWPWALLFAAIHAAVDIGKSYVKKDSLGLFLADQAAHVVTLVYFWALLPLAGADAGCFSLGEMLNQTPAWKPLGMGLQWLGGLLANETWLKRGIGLVVLWYPWQLVVRYVLTGLKLLPNEQAEHETEKLLGLQHAGRLIGRLERVLTFGFVLAGQWVAIGFLLTAKSILRLPEVQNRENRAAAEYVIVGTLLSMSGALAMGWLCG